MEITIKQSINIQNILIFSQPACAENGKVDTEKINLYTTIATNASIILINLEYSLLPEHLISCIAN